ncbi:MAG TPA: Nif3-like dinuclear metal center hexameric protein [Clostridiaceae bacterium]|jgi:dinuclear metal center YbgI/SA1388 family protein|nr:Nif3-like dinuclear metal center hexameric protein [Clostridiaceae bacterium]
MAVKSFQITDELEKLYPLSLCESYDNAGLIIGDREKEIERILLCLDVTEGVMDEAVNKNIDMIISHHPLIFTGQKSILKENSLSRTIMNAIKNDINIYSMHTNFDNANNGMNDILASLLELEDIKPLVNNKPQSLYKFVVYVPASYENIVREAIFKSDAGHTGNYSNCSFNTNGKGTFKPLKGSNPFIGEVGNMEYTDEVRIETIVKEDQIKETLNRVLEVHPYEEVAYDIFPLKNEIKRGTGRVGNLKKPIKFKDFCNYVKEKLKAPYLNVAGDMDKTVKKIAVVGGSGSEFIKDALKCGCDVILTGDIKHHDALDSIYNGINIIDASHYYTEIVCIPYFKKIISEFFDGEIIISNVDTHPFNKV